MPAVPIRPLPQFHRACYAEGMDAPQNKSSDAIQQIARVLVDHAEEMIAATEPEPK